MQSVSGDLIRKFQRATFVKFHIAAFIGFGLGLKTTDYFLYDETPYMIIREDMEDEYWAKHGEPQVIEPRMVTSAKDGNLRKSWISIYFEKDKLIKKKDYFD